MKPIVSYDKALKALGLDVESKLDAMSPAMVKAIRESMAAELTSAGLARWSLAINVFRPTVETTETQASIAGRFGHKQPWVANIVKAVRWAIAKRGIDPKTRLPAFRGPDDAGYFAALSNGAGDKYLADADKRKQSKANKESGKNPHTKRPPEYFAQEYLKALKRFALSLDDACALLRKLAREDGIKAKKAA